MPLTLALRILVWKLIVSMGKLAVFALICIDYAHAHFNCHAGISAFHRWG